MVNMTKSELLVELAKKTIAQEKGFWCIGANLGIIFEGYDVKYVWLIELLRPSQKKIDYESHGEVVSCNRFCIEDSKQCVQLYNLIK